ncbi:MAG TPA: hypothetical protein VFD85_11105 [Gemmatimonadales bacterium]|nr:hypothetical protein [Gemmatimonadales bacterium]
MTSRAPALALAALVACPALIAAQGSRFHFEIQLDGSTAHSNPVIGSVSSSLSGTLFGGEGRVGLGPVALDLGYWQGSLTSNSGPAANEDMVEGKALLGISPVHWFTISGGPMARAYTTAAGTERWLTWRIQGRVEEELVPRTVRAYAELWFIASSSVNVVQPFTSGRGGRVSVRLAPAAWPLWVTLGYGIEQIRLGSGSRIDNVDRVTLGLGYSRR